jgi:putative ABC transport system substrate-binding protein
MRRLGVLMSVADDSEGQARIKPFQQTLHELGWVEGRNIQIDYRWTEGDAKRIPRYASELVALRPDVIFETSSSVLAAFSARRLLVGNDTTLRASGLHGREGGDAGAAPQPQ